jgi:hypothetical protein
MRITKGCLAVFVVGAMLAGCGENQETFNLWHNYGNGTVSSTPPTLKVDVAASAFVEGETVTVTVLLSNGYDQAISVPFTVTGITAGENDVTLTTASPLTVPAGATSATITLLVVDDLFEEEPDLETLAVALGTPSSGSIGTPASVTVTISDNDSDGLDGTISGRVIDAVTGAGVDGVAVTGGGTTTTTANGGRYKLTGVAAASSIVVGYAKSGYVPQSRTTPGMVLSDSAMILNIHLVPLGVASPASFDPATAQTITLDASTAQISLDPNVLQTAAGAAPSGNVTVRSARLLPQSDLTVLPGNYLAEVGSNNVPRESWGGLHVGFVDAGGNVLELSPTQTATIRIPVSTRASTTPSTLTAHFFDPASGLWEPEGMLALVGTAPSQYYEGTITHLGTYSAMQEYTTATVTGCVVDPTGSPVPDALVIAEGINYTGSTGALTGADGTFSISVKSGVEAFVQANKRTGVSNAQTVVGPENLTECLLLVPGAAQIRLSWGEQPFDLDSHTLGPNRTDHTYWIDKGSLSAHPFVALDVDDVDSFGPEVTTIVKAARSRTYRFLVRNYSQDFAPGQTDSPARVELYIKGEQTVFTPPAGETAPSSTDPFGTTAWHVFDLVSDDNCDLSIVTPAPGTPWLSLTEGDMGDPTLNPNPDDAATFCS